MKKRNTKALILSLVFALSVFIVGAVDAYAITQAEADSSPELTLNQAATYTITEKGGAQWYKFTTKEAGYFRINVGPGPDADSEKIGWGWEFSVYKKGDLSATICKIDQVQSAEKTQYFAYAPDTFYIKMQDESEYYSAANCPFTLKVEFNKSDLWESEVNDSAKEADVIQTNTTYSGNLHHGEDVDWFKYTVTKDGYQSVTLSPDADNSDTEKIEHGWKITLYEADNTTVVGKAEEIKAATTTNKYPMKKGDYYIKVQAESTYWNPVGQVYNLKVNEVAEANWEAEHNDVINEANSITLGSLYKGTTYKNEDNDCFKFKVPIKGVLSVSMSKDPETDSEKVSKGWQLEITKENDVKPIFQKKEMVTSFTEDVIVPAGTYYVRIKPENSYWWPDNCAYQFMISHEGFDKAIAKTKVSISKPKAAKGKITVKWKKNDLATGYEVFRSTKAKKGFKKVKSLNAKKLSFVDKKVKAKKTYYYKVRAYIAIDGKKYYSQDSAVKKIKAK